MTSKILAAIWDGDRDAFDTLVQSQTSRLYGIAFKITHDDGLSEDVVQETFVRVLDSRARLRDPAAGEAWLGRIAGRLALDALRRRKARQKLEEQVPRMTRPVRPDPADEVARAEQIRLAGEALGLLEAETRAALVLHIMEGNTIREVAEALGTSRSTVLRRVQSGLKTLERHLKRIGLAVPLAASVGDLLRAVPGPEPPARVYASCQALAERVRPQLATARPGGGSVPGRFPRAVPLVASAIILVGLAYWLWNTDRWGPGREEPRQPVAISPGPPTPGPEEAPPPPTQRAAEAGLVDRPRESVLSGRVLRPDGSPAAGAAVRVHRDITRTDLAALLQGWTFVDLLEKACEPPAVIAEGPCDEEGRFSLAIPLTAGEPIIAVALSPPLDAEWSGALSLASQESTDLEIQLAFALTIAGSVKDPGGAPLAGCTVVALPWPEVHDGTDLTTHDIEEALHAYQPSAATTDAGGRFRVHGLPQLQHSLYALFVRRAGSCSSFMTVPYGPDTADVEVVLEPSRRVRGRVFFTPGDEPAAQARVVAMPLETREPRWFATAMPDARGEFALDISTRIEWKALAKTPGQLFPRRVIVPAGEEVTDLEMDIPRGGTSISGTVRFAESGLPAAGIALLCRDWAGAILSAETTTDGGGRYEFQGLSWSSKAQIIPKLPGHTRRDWTPRSPTREEPHVRLDIELVPSMTLRGIVEDPAGRPVSGVLVEAFSVVDSTHEAAGLRWRREALVQLPCVTEAMGTFVFEDYPPHDRVYLWAYEPDLGEAIAGPLDLTASASQVKDVKISLSGGTVLELALVDPAGRPLEGFHVQVASQEFPGLIPDTTEVVWYAQRTSLDLKRVRFFTRAHPTARSGFTDAGGRLRFAGLLPGMHRVSFSGPTIDKKPGDSFWLLSSVTENALVAGEASSLTVALDVGHRLEGRLERSGGKPLSRHRVHALSLAPRLDGLKDTALHGTAITGEDGGFVISELGPGPYRVTVLDPGRSAALIHERHVAGSPVTLIAPETPERTEPTPEERSE